MKFRSHVMTGMFLAAAAGVAYADTSVPQEIEAGLRAAFGGTRIDAVQASEIPGLYELRMGQNIAYSGAEGRYLLVGHLYDTRTGKDLTQGRLELTSGGPRVNWNDLPLSDAIRSGNGVNKLAVFTDPQCAYCVKLEKALAALDGVERYTFLYPLGELHPQAVAIARNIWCAKTDDAKLTRLRDFMLYGKQPPQAACDASAINRIVAFGERQRFSGTPTLVRGDGAVMFGYRDASQLRAWLTSGSTPAREDAK